MSRPRRRSIGRATLGAVLAGALLSPPATAQDETPAAGTPASYTDEELHEMEVLEQDVKRYERAAELHHSRMRAILQREYDARKDELERRYADQVALAENDHRQKHLEAIKELEAFLAKYPDHAQFTPDAMFRLADLYVDEANYRWERGEQSTTGSQWATPTPAEGDDAGAPDPVADADVADDEDLEDVDLPPVTYTGPDYAPAIALWREIIAKFPQYRQMDGTLYLLAYYLDQTGNERASLQVYLSLVCGNQYKPLDPPLPIPDKVEARARAADKTPYTGYDDCQAATSNEELIEEAWVRGVGDGHFRTPGELKEAIAAFKRVAANKKSRFYDEALYKLAWSYYRNDDFIEGITAFDESVRYSDELVARGEPPLDLREEAIQYIAISFTDPWSVQEQPDPERSLQRANDFYKDKMDQAHVRDVYEKLGDTFRIIEGHPQAIDSWRVAIDRWPLHPRNPIVHQKIVAAYERMGDKDARDEEAAKLASRYRKGTEWYKANETNREAMEQQQRIGQRTLRAAAENTHRNAQIARKDWEADRTPENESRYVKLYRDAAELYASYLQEYPTSDEIYEFTYRLADTYYFSRQYLKSIPHYRWVRDHRELGTKYYLKSALSIVQAYQAEIDQQVAAGQLAEPPVPTADQLKAMGSIQPIPISKLYADLQAAYDEYQRLVEDPKRAPVMALAAAVVSFRHIQFDDAIPRFELVMAKFCGTAEATRAKDGLLVIYDVRGDDVKFTETNDKFITQSCGDEAAIATAKAQNQSKEFQKAEKLFQNQQYDEAALAFYRYYRTAPDTDSNLPVALYNSAIAYDRSGRPKTAVHLFNEFTSHKSPEFKDSPYYLEALFLTAVAHQKRFDYQSAVDVYLDVVKVAGERGRTMPPGGRSIEQIRLDALYNAALLRELDRVYKDPRNQPGTGAASLYERYAKLETDRRKRDRALWAVARVHESAGDMKNMMSAYDKWRREFGRDAGNEQDYVFTYYNTAKLQEKRGSATAAKRSRQDTVKAWATVGSPTGTPTSDMAAEFEFRDAEAYYKSKFENYSIKWPSNQSEKNITRTLDNLDKLAEGTRSKFVALAKYDSPKWSMAALVRIGDVFFWHGQKIIDAPVPKEIERLEQRRPELGVLDQYQQQVEELVKPLQQQGKDQWLKVVAAARAEGVSNEWTRGAQERLHDLVSADDFPMLREEKAEGTETP